MVAQSALCHLLLQLTPRASAWGREKQIFISGPWKRRKGRAETGNPDGGYVVGILFSLGRVWNWGTRMGGTGIPEGPIGVPQDPPEERWDEGVDTEIPLRFWRTGIFWSI